jgi:hypothetical protein
MFVRGHCTSLKSVTFGHMKLNQAVFLLPELCLLALEFTRRGGFTPGCSYTALLPGFRPRFVNLEACPPRRDPPSFGGVNIEDPDTSGVNIGAKRKILSRITNHEHRESNFIRRGGFSSL